MNKKPTSLRPALLFFLAGSLFILASLMNQNTAITVLGSCLIMISIIFGIRYNAAKNDKTKGKDKPGE